MDIALLRFLGFAIVGLTPTVALKTKLQQEIQSHAISSIKQQLNRNCSSAIKIN